MKTVEARLLDMHDLEDVLTHLKIEVPGGAGAIGAGFRTAGREGTGSARGAQPQRTTGAFMEGGLQVPLGCMGTA